MVESKLPASPEALFRYLVISAVKALELRGWRRSAAVREVAGQDFPFAATPRRVSERTLWRWVGLYEGGGVSGLERGSRSSEAASHVLSPVLLAYLRAARIEDPRGSIPELIRRARLLGHLHPEAKVDRTSVWRAMRRMGVPTRRVRDPKPEDTRRFAYRERLQMVLADLKHFRAGSTRNKRVALYFLDDATRYGLDVAIWTVECAEIVLRTLARVLRRYGRFDGLYVDHGPGFIANDLVTVCAQLRLPLILGRVRYPEAHGKIEEFNRSVKARLLRAFDRAPHVDPDLGALELRLRHDLFEVYNHLPHESLAQRGDNGSWRKVTPHERFTGSERALRPIGSEDWLTTCFSLPLERTVSNDHVVRYRGEHFEVPALCRPGKVELIRRPLEDDALYLPHEGQLIRLHPVDVHFNATSERARKRPEELPAEPIPQKTASMLAFDRDHPTMLGPDGGFCDSPAPKEDPDDD